MGLLREELSREGITNLDVVAEGVARGIAAEAAADPLAFYDMFTRGGTDVEATLVAPSGDEASCIVFSQNVYLGLHRHPTLVARVQEAVARYGVTSGGSPTGGGRCMLHMELAKRLAARTQKEAAVIFPTGYTANVGALSSLPNRKDLIIMDHESHASMFDGVKLSGARWLVFRHNDVADLEAKLQLAQGRHPNVFVAIESVYSMSGDVAPVREIVALKRRYPFYLYVDEAHSFGIYGNQGGGYCATQGVQDDVDFYMATMSKALASSGGFVAAKASMCALIMSGTGAYFAHAAMTPASCAAALSALDLIEQEPQHAARLHEHAGYMRARLAELGFDFGASVGPIIAIVVPDQDKLYELAARIRHDGVFALPMTFPVVPLDRGRLRFVITAAHTRQQIDRAVDALSRHARELGLLQREVAR
ncbi:MAG TPA: aminotransferase class I/II-fold pyridoxal phosphate-dependent enzyme [Kofleriaceae bacterium]